MHIPLFSEWIFPMSSRLMDLSTRYAVVEFFYKALPTDRWIRFRFPLISGFYRLLTLCLNVGSKMKLMEVCKRRNRFLTNESFIFRQVTSRAISNCFLDSLTRYGPILVDLAVMNIEIIEFRSASGWNNSKTICSWAAWNSFWLFRRIWYWQNWTS